MRLGWIAALAKKDGLRKLRIEIAVSLSIHLAIGILCVILGVRADKKVRPLYDAGTLGEHPGANWYNRLELTGHQYYFALGTATSGFFFITFAFELAELFMTITPVYQSWIKARRTPITWFEFAVSDAYLSALFIMLSGVRGIGFIFQHAILRSLMNLCGYLCEFEQEVVGDKVKKMTWKQVLLSRTLILGYFCYLVTVGIRWWYFATVAIKVALPAFVWVSFAGYTIELMFPLILTLSLVQWRFFADYTNFKLALMVVSLTVKINIGVSVASGALAIANSL
jgi:hypothetical protein